MNEIKIILSKCYLAAGLGLADIEELAEIIDNVEYKEDEVIIRQDDQSRDLELIYSGHVSIEVRNHRGDGSVLKLQTIRSNSIVGEFSFLDGSRRSADVRAQTDVKLLRFPFDKLIMLMEKNPRIGYIIMGNLAKLLAERIRNVNFELRNQLA